jgi:hypothetical protein
VHSTCRIRWQRAVLSGLRRARAVTLARSLVAMFWQVTGRIACSDRVVRGRVELPTFRFSGWQFLRPPDGVPSPVKRRGRSVVSLPVSFSYVCPGSPGHSRSCRRRSQTATTHGEHGPTDLESVLVTAMTPRHGSGRLGIAGTEASC